MKDEDQMGDYVDSYEHRTIGYDKVKRTNWTVRLRFVQLCI